MPSGEDLKDLAAHGASLALYLSAAQAQETGERLAEAYGDDAVLAICHKVSWPDGRTFFAAPKDLAKTLKENGIDRHALILASPALTILRSGADSPQSKLYDPKFSHGRRQAKKDDR
jgi:precorrin-4/cobalt-precorrin-4 C11-methyltransferase